VVAFGGRLMEGEGPKYLNSADTPVFHKGGLLYGLKAARPAIRDAGRAILVEGYMDWIALHSHGIENVVAGLGTAFGAEQARLLARMTGDVVVLYDGDEAGRKAMFRAGEHLLAQELNVQAVALPDGEDPDSFVRSRGSDSLAAVLSEAPTLIDFFFSEALRAFDTATPPGKIKAAEFLAPLIRAIPKPEHREAWTGDLRVRLGIHQTDLFTRSLRQGRGWETRGEPNGGASPKRPPASDPPAERAIIGEALRGEERLELRFLNRLVRHIEHWEFFEGAEAEFFSRPDLAGLFHKICGCARDIREGAPRPTTGSSSATPKARFACLRMS
jgi:DNA primase